MKKHILLLSLLSWLILGSCSQQIWHVADVDTRNFNVDDSQKAENAEITDMIAPYKIQLDEIMDKEIIVNKEIMYKQKPNSALGNWMSDALMRQGKLIYGETLDFALQNHGGIRIPNLPAGPVTMRKMYELMPFDNMLLVLHCKGNIVQQLANRIVEYGGWPISQELRLVKDTQDQIQVYINDEPLDMQREYHFLIPDYIANGGDDCSFLKDQKRDELGVLLRDLFIKDLEQMSAEGKQLEANKQIRIQL